jgi:RHS repeat-associated protein
MVKTGGHNYDALRRLCNQCVFPSRYTGKERDTESGLDYFGARYYASSMGRFMSPDWASKPEAVPYSSLSDPQTLNLYGYMRNNPLGGTDKDGHCGQQQSGGTTCPTVTVTATPATQPAPVQTTTVTDASGNQHTGTSPSAQITLTVKDNNVAVVGATVSEKNQVTTTLNGTPVQGAGTIDTTVKTGMVGTVTDTVGAPQAKGDPAQAAAAYNGVALTIVDKQTLTVTIPGAAGCTCTLQDTRTLSNTPDGKTISPGGYTLTTTQPVVTTPKPPQ